MQLQYLGTAAAEGVPAMFCTCEVCKKAMKAGGRNIRTRSQAIIDDALLIDFPPDTYMHFLTNQLSFSKVKTCIITHSHQDHLYTNDITMRKEPFARNAKDNIPLCFYSDNSGYKKIKEVIDAMPESKTDCKLIELNKTFLSDGYAITPIRATHAPASSPVVYIIEKSGKTLFYSNDTDNYSKDSWNYLENCGKRFDLVSFDCTKGDIPMDYTGHLDMYTCNEIRERFFEIGLADKSTIFVLNHFSHGNDKTYDEFVKIAEKYGYIVSYDGMKIEI